MSKDERSRRYLTMSAILPPTFFLQITLSEVCRANAAPAVTAQAVTIAPAQAPQLDGNPDESIWRKAQVIGELQQVTPIPGAAASVVTDVRLLQDGTTLYVAIVAHEQSGYVRIARQTRRDALLDGDDHFALVLDPANGGRNGYLFRVNANGAQYDALIYDGAEPREDWDAIWDVQVQSRADGWRAELAIPLNAMTANGGGVWGVNVERYLAGSGERLRWQGNQPDREVTTLQLTGALSGVPSQTSGHGLRVKPSLRLQQNDRSGDLESSLEPGLDVFWRVRPDTTATLTLNSDFAEAEADDRELNLTRFPLLLPEKREFFLQDAGVFAFGGLQENLLPFFSRRIGIDEDGTPLALDGGVKLTHESHGIDAGLLAVRVEEGPTTDATSVGVGRVALRTSDHTRLGIIGTTGNPVGTDGSSTWGMDWQFRDPQFLPDRSLAVDVWTQTSHNDADYLKGDNDGASDAADHDSVTGSAHGIAIDWDNIGPTGDIAFWHVDDNFAPALGFVTQTGVEGSYGEGGYWWRTAAGGDVIPQLEWDWSQGLDDGRRYLLLNPELYLGNAFGDYFMPELNFERETLIEDFEIVPGLTIPAGEYRYDSYIIYAAIGGSRAVSGEAVVRWGEFYNGRREDYELFATIRPAAQWGVTVRGQQTDLHLPAGDERIHLLSLGLELTPTPRIATSALAQWDSISDEVGVNLRLRWTIEPGQDIYVSLNRLFQDEDGFSTTARDESVKVAWNWMW